MREFHLLTNKCIVEPEKILKDVHPIPYVKCTKIAVGRSLCSVPCQLLLQNYNFCELGEMGSAGIPGL